MQKAMVPVVLAPAEAGATGEAAPGPTGEAAAAREAAPAGTPGATGETAPPANGGAPSDTLGTAAMSYLCLPCARLRISIPAG
jgi:hypothetical protein